MENSKKVTRSTAVLRVAETILCVIVLALAINITSCESYLDTMFNIYAVTFGAVIPAVVIRVFLRPALYMKT